MSNEVESGKGALGCLIVMLAVFFVLPMWYILLFWILYTLSAPGYIWALYWCYAPMTLIVNALGKALENMR